MIKINKISGYLLGLIITFVIYVIGQLFFFINTTRTKGTICDITSKKGTLRNAGRTEIFYVCFTTKDGENVKKKAGSNLEYEMGDTVSVVYKTANPHTTRIDHFSELWIVPAFIYIIPFAVIMGIITAIFYKRRHIIITLSPFKITPQ